MSYHLWKNNNISSKKRAKSIQRVRDNANKVISHKDTKLVYVDFFPEVNKYLLKKFPDVDISLMPIYKAFSEIMDKFGFSGCGGCYIKPLYLILVKNEIKNTSSKSRFEKILHNECGVKADVEDVVVHELIHAISHKIDRASRKFVHMEEEFVYTNCVDFYSQKGLSEEEIVSYNFLPFCINDIYNSRTDMIKVLHTIGVTIGKFDKMNKKDKLKLFDTHAEELIKTIKSKAIERGRNMIKLYRLQGDETKMGYGNFKDKVSMRFSSLDLD